jgi:hypothetical protein
MAYPRIYLAVDNCFATKRWPHPLEWATLLQELEIGFAEANADNDLDPFTTTPEYRQAWIRSVEAAQQETGVSVANLFSGIGTYTTLGLGHTDRRIRDRMLSCWLKPMTQIAASLQAGIGFFCHAFDDATMQSPEAYARAEENLCAALADVAQSAADCGTRAISVEQFGVPHQIPWTLQGTQRLLREVWSRSKQPFYITIDIEHQSSQHKFLRPSHAQLREALDTCRAGGQVTGLWLGPRSALGIFRRALALPVREQAAQIRRLQEEMDRHLHLFASSEDGDTRAWLEQFACHSPIIHLKAIDAGYIAPPELLRAVAVCYEREADADLPPRCTSIYLTFELFSETVHTRDEIMNRLAACVTCWRQYVPRDGMRLDELIGTLA